MRERENWMQRFLELAKQKPQENVLANGKVEVMTNTQAYRFRELQGLDRQIAARKAANAPADQQCYTLDEAAERLSADIEQLLAAIAGGQFRCYVRSAGLSGQWQVANSGNGEFSATGTLPTPEFLALTMEACREIRQFGSTNVSTLIHPAGKSGNARFCLRDPQWIDPARMLLMHPLPKPGTLL